MHHKFNIDDTSGVLLEVERHRCLEGVFCGSGSGNPGAQVVAHLGAHLADLLAQGRQIPLAAQHTGTHLLKRRPHLLAAHQHASTHQCLMLPGPGFVFLIALKGTERTDQQPRSA